MTQKSEFQTVEFFRKVRDEQASFLAGKSREEIIAYFASFHKPRPGLTSRSTRTRQKAARR
jgi:hypothetical protein